MNKNHKKKEKTPEQTEIISKKLCDPFYDVKNGNKTKEEIVFNLTNNQKFLKAFLGPSTPYNSMLLFHETGVGKTCTSIIYNLFY